MNPRLSKEEILAREGRWLRPAGLIAIAGALIFAAGVFLQQAGVDRADTDAERLTQFHDDGTQLVAGQVLQGLGVAAFAFPLYVLFKAAEARADRVRSVFVGLCLIGPVLFGVSLILLSVGLRDAADTFVERVPAVEQEARESAPSEEQAVGERKTTDEVVEDARDDLAEDVLRDSSLARAGSFTQVAAIFALLGGLVYTSLWGVRTGLLSRFWGSLGMALAIGLILLGSFGLLLLVLWFAVLGIRFAGFAPGGMPPAWAAGAAVPWEPQDGVMPASTVEGSGREVSEPALPEEGESPDDADASGEGDDQQLGETQGQRRKKRKRRG